MRIPFTKYQATANDFIIVNQAVVPYLQSPPQEMIAHLCDRRRGIGADGLMIIAPSEIADFKMIYYNADGRLSTMCGNGGRAISHLAHQLKLCASECSFEAVDGLHEARIDGSTVRLKMIDVPTHEMDDEAYVIDTGSPHYVKQLKNIANLDIVPAAQAIRYGATYAETGINVNFIEDMGTDLHVRTYERGVEDETYSCGTGVTAAAISHVLSTRGGDGDHEVSIITKGGNLKVSLTRRGASFSDVWLTGPAVKSFDGTVEV